MKLTDLEPGHRYNLKFLIDLFGLPQTVKMIEQGDIFRVKYGLYEVTP